MPESSMDAVINEYKKHVDISILEENLKLSYTERIQKLQQLLRTYEELQKLRKSKA
jgi:hypothetical protein